MANNDKEPLRSREDNQPKIEDENIKTIPASPKRTPLHHNNNNHHVVPAGILIVLCTLYLSTTALNRSYETQIEEEITLLSPKNGPHDEKLSEGHHQIALKELVEDENVCRNWEIFTVNLEEEDVAEEIIPENDADEPDMEEPKRSDVPTNKVRRKKRINYKKTKKSLQKKVNNMHNKSARVKQQKLQEAAKKDPQAKKNTTAEPIIYLFALVFIYLLLKAASDINQHYKSEAKGDKRLRRCSLQSYAQQHKQDRRASKDSFVNHKQRLMEVRSKSFDRFGRTGFEYSPQKHEILTSLRKYTSLDDPNAGIGNYPRVTMLIGLREKGSTEALLPVDRRGSVPVLQNADNQRVIGSAAGLDSVSRRTSMVGMGGSDWNPYFPENKRRVRMINRH